MAVAVACAVGPHSSSPPMLSSFLVLLCCMFVHAQVPGGGGQPSLYANSDVIEADAAMLKQLESSGGALVAFYAPWCGHCHKIVPDVKKAATMLKSKGVRVAALNSDASPGLAQSLGIRGFPAIRWMAGGKGEEYKGTRTALELVQFAAQQHTLSAIKGKVREVAQGVKAVGKLAMSKIVGRQAEQGTPSAQGMGLQTAAVPAAAA
mgnify:CR=1 FL=1